MKKMHENSLKAFEQLKPLGPRHRRILQIFHITGRAMTDREIKEFGKYDDLNDVRPRISELLSKKYGKRLKYVGDVICVKTRIPVRKTRLSNPEEILTGQGELW